MPADKTVIARNEMTKQSHEIATPALQARDDENLIGAPKIWVAEFVIPLSYANFFTESLEEISIGIKCYEQIEDNLDWILRVYFQEKPDSGNIEQRVAALCSAVNLTAPEIKIFEIENKNWVLELAKEFKAIQTSEFHIYSQFSEPSKDHINIRINPGMAFGTGQHETTYLCLEAISWLRGEKREFSNILDLGCGSGILAIAASKIWEGAKISASDNDPIAVDVCIENAEVNDCRMTTYVSEGFDNIVIARSGNATTKQSHEIATSASPPRNDSFDLILANILMNPLLQLANDMAKFGTTLVLSGFKSDQTEELMAKYESVGFTVQKLFVRNHWVAAILSS